MQFTDHDLKNLIDCKVVGSAPDVLRIIRGLKRSQLLDVEAAPDSYGGGTASYFDVFCSKRGGKSTIRKGNTDFIEGIAVYLCRLASVAIYGPMLQTRSPDGGGSRGYLKAEVVGTLPPGDWTEEIAEIRMKLTTYYAIALLDKNDLVKKLPFNAIIPTIFKRRGKGYQVFDAIFYYSD